MTLCRRLVAVAAMPTKRFDPGPPGKGATRVPFFCIDCVEKATPPGASRAAPNPSNEPRRAIDQSSS
jgi:hypothetical protein